MSRHRYGQGNGPTIARLRRISRRQREAVSAMDERDMGNRPGLESLFGFGEDVAAVCTCNCAHCTAGVHGICGRLPCEERAR